MKECKVDEKQIGEWIENANDEIWYISPGIKESLASKIADVSRRNGTNFHIMVSVDGDMDRFGYGDIKAAEILKGQSINIKDTDGIGISVFAVKGNFCAFWSPLAECVDDIDRILLNGFQTESDMEQKVFQDWIKGVFEIETHNELFKPTTSEEKKDEPSDTIVPVESSPTTTNNPEKEKITSTKVKGSVLKPKELTEEKIKREKKSLIEHPPRDIKNERELTVYGGYGGFIEIHLKGSKLSKSTRLQIPQEFIELDLEENLRRQLSQSMIIDLSDYVDLGVQKINKKVEAFREIFTVQLGRPLGRIFRKKDWEIMQRKADEINDLVNSVNPKIKEKLKFAARKTIKKAAYHWYNAINGKTNENYSLYDVEEMFLSQWNNRLSATQVKFDLFVKDLTWETLNNTNVREEIEKAFPDICKTGLYNKFNAHG